MPISGRPAAEVAADLEALSEGDRDFAGGRTFGLVYHARPDVEAVVRAAHDRYVWHNALNPDAFPSLRTMSAQIVAATAWLLSGGAAGAAPDEGLAGFLTSGGTESILMGVKAAKVRAHHERGVERPNIVLPTSAHAAFDKACQYFGVEPRRVDVDATYRADVDAMADACDDATVLVVGSAPQYPQGVIDPIPDVAALAADRGTSCHVDACMGGFCLPFLERAGLVDTPWDFRVPGVTTISADLHKYGFVPKGVSVIMHRDRASRRNQTFVFDGWLGGMYASSGILGTKPGGPIAAAWAALQHLGVEGYVELATQSFRARQQLVAGVRGVEGLDVVGEPEVTLAAITADPSSPVDVDVFRVHDELSAKGWYLDRQAPPDSLHATCTPVHEGAVLDELITDIRAAVEVVGAERTGDRSTKYAALE